MLPRLKAFVFWLVLPYSVYIVVVTWMGLSDNRAGSWDFWVLKYQIVVLTGLFIPALLGTAVLWMVPLRTSWLGIVLGPILAVAGILLWVWVEWGRSDGITVILFGGITVIPSCIAGAYAGFSRARQHNVAVLRTPRT